MEQPFSNKLEAWLKKPGKKTFGSLEDTFEEKSFGVAFLLLMSASALPIPTGGITNILELIAMILAIEMIAGRKQIWSPQSWRQRSLGENLEKKALPKFIRIVRWFEKYSRRRLAEPLENSWVKRLIGVIIFVFALAAFFSVPFSGLDTLPALGVVILSLALILGDAVLFIVGTLIGAIGVALVVSLGRAAWHLFF